MDFENFKEQFTEDVGNALSERGIDAAVTTNTVEKMNESYEALTITPEGSHVGVNLNMDRFFEAYENGVSYDEVLSKATDVAEQGIKESPAVDIASLTNYDIMKEKLAMEVVSIEANADLLNKIPHQQIEDMAVIYRCVLTSGEEGMSSVVVTNAMLNTFGVTAEQLHADAMENAPEIKPAVIKGMTEVMQEMMGDDFASIGFDINPADEVMYVATVPDKVHGAGVIAYQDFMDQAAERLGGDFFVLPSSIHEVLLVRDDGQSNFHDLEAMVQEVILIMKKMNIKSKLVRVAAIASAFFIGATPLTAFAQANPETEAVEVEVLEKDVITDTEETEVEAEIPYHYTVNEDGSIVFSFNGEEYTYGAEADPTGKVVTGGSRLNVRTGAGMDYEIIDQLCPGEEVSVIGTEGDWYQIIVPAKTGYSGV